MDVDELQRFLKLPRAGLSAAQRDLQRDHRERQARTWASSLIPRKQCLRLAMMHFGMRRNAATKMFERMEALWALEAQLFEERPRHQQRHQDRMTVEHIIAQCIAEKRYTIALRGMELLTKLNGTQMPEQVEVSGGLELWRTAAKGLSMEELRRIATTGESMSVETPVTATQH